MFIFRETFWNIEYWQEQGLMIEIIGCITGIGFLIWLTAFIILYAVAKHWMDR